MADARIPERYLVDRAVIRLSDTERSSYFMATLWCVSNRTDGALERSDLQLIPTFQESVVPKLVESGLWVTTGKDSWVIADYVRTQTTRAEFEVLDNIRRADREKKKRQRAGKALESPGLSPGHVPRDSTGRKARQEGAVNTTNPQTGDELDPSDRVTSWPIAAIGSEAST